ncbi:DUF6491 family protein [Marinicella gelatinilytica]|uniref:DUF6491 family protein n=1 Tax=Marinicella gelatinilytica TaxID=2996017 RepID=UPI002260D41F|nr:DUF6491 family protein [Marinicella gelatinilytica]MCX7545255.1 DUF6491 family protein [Marinicella gelatinilytica]
MYKALMMSLILTLAACHSNQVRPKYDQFVMEQDLKQVSRVQQFRFTGWQPLDSDYLILLGTHRKAYLLELMSPCNDLPFAQNIALKQTSRSSLVAKFDKVLVQDQMPESCTIDKIYELTEEQHQAIASYSGGHIKATKPID